MDRPDGWILKPIPHFAGYYADQNGNVWSSRSVRPNEIPELHKLRASHGSRLKYPHVVLFVGRTRKNVGVHRAVCEAFHGLPPTSTHQVRHMDGNFRNSIPMNLRWGTPRENQHDRRRHGTVSRGERSGKAKLTDADVRQIRALYRIGIYQMKLAEQFKVGQSTISSIVRMETWKHVTEEE